MSDGHADKSARSAATPPPEPGDTPALPVAPEWYARPELRPVFTTHDVGALSRALTETGLTQHQIARLTGQQQSEISEILKGRRVIAYDVLVRLTQGLAIPRERMGLSWWGPDGSWHGPDGAYPEGATVANVPKGVSAEMLRRHLIALGGAAMVGSPVAKLGELLTELPGPDPVPLPSHLSHAYVTKVRDLTRRLGVGDTSYPDPEVSSAAAAWATRLLDVPAPAPVRQPLLIAVAELHCQAGWSAFDAGLYRRALHHYARTLELATEARDTYLQVLALRHAGLASVEHGYPDDGLKMLQCAQAKAWDIPLGDQRAVVVGVSGRAAAEACALQESATALVCLGQCDAAVSHLTKGRQLWTPTHTDPHGDMDRPAARLELARERLDAAEALAVASLRRWEGGRQFSRTQTGIVLATVHVKAGERGGPQLAHNAITAVSQLSSVRVRRQLVPLAEALAARPGSDAKELALMAQQVATTRA